MYGGNYFTRTNILTVGRSMCHVQLHSDELSQENGEENISPYATRSNVQLKLIFRLEQPFWCLKIINFHVHISSSTTLSQTCVYHEENLLLSPAL